MGTKRPPEDHYEGDGKRIHYDQQDRVHPSRRSRFSDAPDDRDRDSHSHRPSSEQRSPRQPRPDKRSRTDSLRRTDDSFRSPDARKPLLRKPRGRPPPHKAKAASSGTNALKAKIRDLTRLLEHPDSLPADIRLEKERALTGYKLDLAAASKEKAKQAIIKKYHMIKPREPQS
ncbi:rRNA-processing protein EFG1 [Lasallia pustulata]|uniref:rRNA-processing protein EFG1 n=1 Tax=Lasallia pustulata TaxID=136370 RepID=A0A1W5CY25_9LECA|nr:rRNA-processing protein EFG1 [Lasallia pustulata]